MNENDAIVMFAKAPEPGRVKTRLAASIGEREAAAFHAAFIDDLAQTASALDVRRVLAYAGDSEHPGFAQAAARNFDFVTQGEGNLGARLNRVVRACVADGAQRVLVIGSDSPTLQPSHFQEAFARLDTVDVVLGPSFDGGYYLVGARAPWIEAHASAELLPIFRDIDWSTPDVLAQTLRRCQEVRCLCDLMGFWYDVDTLKDLHFLKVHLLEFLCHSAPELAPATQRRLRELEKSSDFTSD